MAVSYVARQEWADLSGVTTGGQPITLPNVGGTMAAGDRTYVFATWKDFSVTATVASNSGTRPYTEVTQFADGSVGAGNGVGSMKVGAWYKDWLADDDGPTWTPSGTVNSGGIHAHAVRKGASDTWDTPLFATAAWPLGGSPAQTVSASSTVAVTNDSLVLAMIGIRDDSSTFTRNTTAIDVASGITWNGDYVETPAVHLSTTNGNDSSGDAGYRLVTTGGTVTLRVTATLSADETGAVLWVMQGATTAAVPRVPFYRPMTQLLGH